MATSYSLFKSKFKKSIAEAIYNEVQSGASIYHHFLGKENSWTDFLSPFIPSSPTDQPGPPQDNFRYDLHVRRDILTTKRINPSDVAYIAPRYDWSSGKVFDMYDDAITPTDPAYSGATRLEDAHFYVLTDEFNVYKCISNNYNSPSTIKPTGTNVNTFTTSDGYIWKFMYTIPVALKNRFLSTEYIPVTTALKAQYYSGGNITNINIEAGGYNYLTTITGAGTISSSSTTKTITGLTTHFTAQVKHNYVLKTLAGDVIGTVDTVNSDTSITLHANALITTSNIGYYISPEQSAYAVITGDGFLENNPYVIIDINISDPGEGYSSIPNIEFSSPTVISGLESTATGEVTISLEGTIDTATLLLAGYGYASAPIISVDEPFSGALAWDKSTEYSLSDIVSYGGRYYEVTIAGTTGSTGPIHTSGAQLNGTAELTYVGKIAVLNAIIEKTDASIELIITNGEITNTHIVDGGVGYTYANIQIFDTNHPHPTDGRDSSNAFLSVNLDVGNINTLQSNVELMAIKGTIEYIKVVDQGKDYSVATVEVIGDGSGATAVAVLQAGKLVGINMTNKGSGYTWTTVNIYGNGSGATARAIMSPLNGHGKDAIDELNANSIMFYSSVARDYNQGLIVTNDYRKVGLLKNIRHFGSTARYNNQVGSGCVLISGVFDISKLDYDMLLVNGETDFTISYGDASTFSVGEMIVGSQSNAIAYVTKNPAGTTLTVKGIVGNFIVGEIITGQDSGSTANYVSKFSYDYKHYRVVEFNDTQILLSVFNNFNINIFDTLVTPNSDQIYVTDVTERTIDPFSGELLFLSVREPFAPSDDQIITVRTVVTI